MNCFPITLTLEDERKKRNRLIKRKSRYRKLLRMAKPDVALNSGLRDFPLDDALEQASHAYFDMLPLEMNAATEPEKALNSEVLACNSPVNSFLSGWPLGSGNHKEIINTSDSGFAKELQLWTTEVNQVNFDNLLCESAMELARLGASPTISSHTEPALHHAVMLGRQDIVRLLLHHKALVDSLNSSGMSPLHIAVSQGDRLMVRLLLLHFPNVNLRDGTGRRALDIAIGNGDAAIVQLLLANGAVV
ncbi:hypothetical protein Purlil1_111 [Purpureocillium lilacinum]|uniref:Ankyrin repeats (3 copies) domain-containing protein n=1 Tax=Purpureocillium lilacinum TaxID=33203 RepID=A0ABR0CGT9_PURLI|nr:hypothetical protein Purlil1_111 [Purpureocillium lilacinum]